MTGSAKSRTTRVVLEVGRTWVFASAVDWPGWARKGKGEDAAMSALAAYEGRYRTVVPDLPAGAGDRLEVVEVLAGTTTTDVGAPGVAGRGDEEPVEAAERDRQIEVLDRCWEAFDAVAAAAPDRLRKGPRGGGRDRDAIIEHTREAERAYGRKVGSRVPPRTPWPEQREALRAALSDVPDGTAWSFRYAVRRTAWHLLDHAWEIEDRAASDQADRAD